MDARETIFSELSTANLGPKKVSGDAFMIACPFHGDTDPSCGVNLTTDTDIPLGFYHCFGCGAKGGWNTLAEKLGLQQLKGWELEFTGNGATKEQRKRKKDLLYVDPNDSIREAINTTEYIPWPRTKEWRGYTGELIRKLNGIYYRDRMTKENMLFLPVYINNSYVGGVRAYRQKQVNGNNYLTTKGRWTINKGLLGYDYVKHVVKKNGYTSLAIVEGPRDMFRLISNQIPALPILGSELVNEKKIQLIMNMSSNIETLYVIPDNDKAGAKMYRNIKRCSKDLIKTVHLKLPKEVKGKAVKVDPDNCSQRIVNEIKDIIDNERR